MKGAKQIIVITAAAVIGAGISAVVVQNSFSPGRDTVRTVIRPVTVTSGANASLLKSHRQVGQPDLPRGLSGGRQDRRGGSRGAGSGHRL